MAQNQPSLCTESDGQTGPAPLRGLFRAVLRRSGNRSPGAALCLRMCYDAGAAGFSRMGSAASSDNSPLSLMAAGAFSCSYSAPGSPRLSSRRARSSQTLAISSSVCLSRPLTGLASSRHCSAKRLYLSACRTTVTLLIEPVIFIVATPAASRCRPQCAAPRLRSSLNSLSDDLSHSGNEL
jgi:hypothetical protein